jgi:DNA gyrase subunit A
MATQKGIVKKTPIKEYENIRKTGLQAINLREDDELIEVKATNNKKDIILVTKNGQCIRFNEKDVRKTGRASMGVIGMNLDDNDEIIGMQLSTQGEYLLFVSEKGMGKRTDMDEFSVQRRGGKGVKCYKITEKTGYVIGVKAVNEENEIMIITTGGILIRLAINGISNLGRITSGVKLIDMDSDITVASIAKVRDNNAQNSEEDVIKQLEQELEDETSNNSYLEDNQLDDEEEYEDDLNDENDNNLEDENEADNEKQTDPDNGLNNDNE